LRTMLSWYHHRHLLQLQNLRPHIRLYVSRETLRSPGSTI
jgi:hypothetical protein